MESLEISRLVTFNYFFRQLWNNKGADQTARMHRLVCAFVVHKQQSQGFLNLGLYGVEG